jgi:RNA polymerase sigma factor (sigma-70 family)
MEDWAETVVGHLGFIRGYLWNWSSPAMVKLGEDDLVQEVALKLLLTGPPADTSHLHDYISVVARRVALDALRRKKSRPQEDPERPDLRAEDPSERAYWEGKMVETLSTLAQMPDRRAAKAILLCSIGFTIEEVAKMLDIGTATVKSDNKTARAYLGKAA